MPFAVLEVAVNGESAGRVGGADLSVLAATLTYSQRSADSDERHFELRVGGLTHPDSEGEAYHQEWVKLSDLAPGTEITFRIASADQADAPTRRYKS